VYETGQSIKSIEVFNLLGESLKTTYNTNLSLEEFPNGIYVLKIRTVKGKLVIAKVIKK